MIKKKNVINLLVFFSFFPYFNFGLQQEVIPVAMLLLILVLPKSKKFWLFSSLFVVIITLDTVFISFGTMSFQIMTHAYLLIVFVSLIYSNFTIEESVMKYINIVWFISILLSNFNIFTSWSSLSGVLFRRVYTCNLPMSCSRGGSGFAPEPAYAAIILFFVGLYFIMKTWKNSNSSLIFHITILFLSLILLNSIIAYFYAIILLFLLLFYRINFKNMMKFFLVIPIIFMLYSTMVDSNKRIYELVRSLDKIATFESLPYLFTTFGSTREIGTICGYKESSLFVLSQENQRFKFDECQNEYFFRNKGKILDSGWKPYSPVAFIFLYYGSIIGLLYLMFFLYPFLFIKDRGMKIVYLITFLILASRITVIFPIPYFLIAYIINQNKRCLK